MKKTQKTYEVKRKKDGRVMTFGNVHPGGNRASRRRRMKTIPKEVKALELQLIRDPKDKKAIARLKELRADLQVLLQ